MRVLIKTLGVILVLVLVGAVSVYMLSENRIGTSYTSPLAALAIPTAAEPDQLARGAYLSAIMGCQDCHGADLSGKLLGEAPPFRIEPPNLTSGKGGVGANYDAGTWERAVRHGIGYDGRGLYIMPSSAYKNLSDADMAALIAFLESVPPVDGAWAGVQLKPLGRALVAFGVFKPEVWTEAVQITSAPPVGASAEYGHYLASITCMHCHGATLEGGPNPDPAGKPVPSLRASAQWPTETFSHAVRDGMVPDGRRLDPAQMPWVAFSAMSDDDIAALHAYLRGLGNEQAGTETD